MVLASLSFSLPSRAWTFSVQSEQSVTGTTTGLAGAQVDDGASEILSEADVAPDVGTSPSTQSVTAGSVVSGTFPSDIASQDGSFIDYRESASANTNHYPSTETITTGSSCGGAFPADLQSSNNAYRCLRESTPGTIAFDAASSTNGQASSFSWSHTTSGTNRVLVVGVSIRYDLTQTVSSVTYGGTGLTFIRRDRITPSVRSELWYLVNPATGANTVQVTLSASAKASMGAISLTGVDQTTPLDANGGATGNSTTPSATVTTVANNAWVVDVVSFRSTGNGIPTGTAGGGQTERWSEYTEGGGSSVNIRGKGSHEGPKTPAGAVVMDWTLSAMVDWAITGASFKPVPAQFSVRHDWSGIPTNGDYYNLCVEAHIANAGGESMLVQVLTPPATWNTRITVSKTADDNADQCYVLQSQEFNSGAPSIRWLGGMETGDSVQSDLNIDQERVILTFGDVNNYPTTQTITTGSNCGGAFPLDLSSSNNAYLCLREGPGYPTATIAFDAASSTNGQASSFSWSHTTSGTNRVLVVGVSIRRDASQTVSSVTYGGTGLTFIRRDQITPSVRAELWYLVNPATGANTVLVTLSASAKASMGAISMTGVDQTTPLDANGGATGNSTTPSATVTTVADNAWVVDVVSFRSTGVGVPTGSAGGGQTQRWSQYTEGNQSIDIRGKGSTEGPKTPAGAVVMDWTLSATADWAITAASFKPVASNQLSVRHDWSGIMAGGASYDMCVEAHIANAGGESMLVQVLTPPATWNTRITVSKTADDNADQCYTTTVSEFNAGAPSIRWIGGTETGDTTQSDANIDHERIIRRSTPSNVLGVEYDWAGVPGGSSYALTVKGYRTDEDMNVQVLTPPATWNTRIVVNAVANAVFTYAMTAAEYNGGAPQVRFVDVVPSPDASASDLFLDAVQITTVNLQYSLEVRQNVTGIMNGRNPTLLVKGNISAGGENFNVHVWNFTTGAWDVLLAAPFVSGAAYHNAPLAPDDLSGGTVRVRFVDAATADTVRWALSLDYVAVDITNTPAALSNNGVSPTSGNISTAFTFFVRYTDLENEAPSFVNLTLGGTPYAMAENNSADTNYADGKDYFLVRTIGVRGTFPYFFSTRASAGDVSLVSTPAQTVTVVNRMPSITNGLANDTVHAGRAYARDFNGTDPDLDVLTWSISTNASWLSIGPANGTVWGRAPSFRAWFSVNVTASDGYGGSASNAYILSVGNLAPSITNPVSLDGVHSARSYARDFNATDLDGDGLAWSLATNASWLSIGAVNGTVWGIAPVSVATYWVNVTVDDGFGGVAWDAYVLSVGNLAPSITNPIATDTVHAARGYLRDFNAIDPDGDVLSWSIASNASWLSVGAANGTVWGTAGPTLGTAFVNVTTADGYSGVAWVNYTLTVGNVAPSIANPIALDGVHATRGYARDFNAADPDGDVLTWSLTTNASWLAIGVTNGTVWGSAVATAGSTFDVNVTANDGFGGLSWDAYTLAVGNVAPTITNPIATASTGRGASFARSFSAMDPDADTVVWSLRSNAAFLSIGAANGTVYGVTANIPATYWVEVQVSDGLGGTDLVNFTLAVVNAPPQVSLSAASTAVENDTYVATLTGSDPDGDALTWSLATNASWLSLNAPAGTFGGPAVAGTYYANVTARDPYGGVASQNVTIVVSASAPPPPPTPAGGPESPWTSFSVLALGVAAFLLAILIAAKPRRRSVLEQAFLLDVDGAVRFAFTARVGPLDEPALRALLAGADWQQGGRISSDPYVLHLVHRPEGHWVLVSRSSDAAQVRREAESLFAQAKADISGPGSTVERPAAET